MRILLCFCLALWGGALRAEEAPGSWRSEWPQTDFSRASVPLSEILSGGPPKDGIPALDGARFEAAAEASIPDDEPVIVLALEGATARAYPIRYLTWHEIVNDEIAGRPVTITFCPLCNSAIVFDGRLGERRLSFGVSGKLRHSDMVMYDRQTESWWQQFTGEAIVGSLTGAELTMLPSWMESMGQFRARFPSGLVMAAPEGARRPYGQNPYAGYDSAAQPFLYNGEMPPHGIPPLARVIRVGARAWPLERLRAAGEIREAGLRLTWTAGQASALDGRQISGSRDVGSVRVFDASGAPALHEVVFAFAFHAFAPDGQWMLAP